VHSEAPALAFRDVTKVYGPSATDGRPALAHVTLEVARGRRVAIVGRSGSGKSTLLHLAAGIDLPTIGAVLVGGQDLARLSDPARTRLRREAIGLVFQFFHLLPHLTVRDNVALPGLIAHDAPAALRRRADELLARVDLAERADDPVQRLSGGEQQRVAICRALLRRPRLLLADEPTGNLDDASSQVVMSLMLDLARAEGSTVVYVTHSREIAELADERHRLHSGVLEPE
jgi:ABC-type lipoprotein export system ATPase subunit